MAKRRFVAQESTIKKELRNTMTKIDASSLKIEQDEFSGEVKVIFDRNGKRYTKTCSKWIDSRDNLRAIGLSIEYLYRAVEVYGVESKEEFNDLIDQVFIGLEAAPNDDALLLGFGNLWWNVLGVKSDATKTDITNAYKSLAKIHHPDNGGDKEQFIKLRTAYEEGINSNI